MEPVNIAIDGPSGVGKSTIAKRLAKRLGYTYIDTGAMFRTLAVYFMQEGIDAEDEEAVLAALPKCSVSFGYVDGEQHCYLNGKDVTEVIRTEEISRIASVTSQYDGVRKKLLDMQRDMAKADDSVMDGRDIGTVVLPDAQLKVFLTAEDSIRAERRYRQLEASGKLNGMSLKEVEADMKERDHRDSHRENAPLIKADDAVLIDNSRMTEEELEGYIAGLLNEKISETSEWP